MIYLLLLGSLSLYAYAHTPTAEPTPPGYWEKVACVPNQGIPDCNGEKGPGIAAGVTIVPGTVECDGEDPEDCQCADYWELYPEAQNQDWIMAMASIFAMCMAFGIGANDAANSWATSVGAKAITVGYAVMLCGFFEWAGATTVGYGVSKTIQKGVSKISDPECWACGSCDSSVTLMMGGSLGALVGASMFLLLASGTAVPVSTTHSIVGGVVGMTMAGIGSGCLNWDVDGGLSGIVLSWIISPLLSGIIAALGYSLSLVFIIRTKNARKRALITLPLLYGFISFSVFMMLFLKAKAIKKKMTLTVKFVTAGIIGGAIMLIEAVFLNPLIKEKLPSETGESDKYLGLVGDVEDGQTPQDDDDPTKTKATYAPISPKSEQGVELAEKKMQSGDGKDDPVKRIDSVVVAKNPETTKLEDWSVETTLRWLTSTQGGRFAYLAETWGKNKIDGECVKALSEEELKNELEVTSVGDRKALLKSLKELEGRDIKTSLATGDGDDEIYTHFADAENADQLDAIFVFRYLVVFTACLESFAHGSNDTANATGPFSAVYQVYTNGGRDCSSDKGTVWIMCVAGIFVAIGVCTFGYRVIRTIGSELTMIDFHKGFYIEVGSTLATMIATVLEFPVSTTHCQVGGVIGVGLVTSFNGKGSVSWSLFSKIFLTWVLTLPIAGGIAALVVLIVKGALIREP